MEKLLNTSLRTKLILSFLVVVIFPLIVLAIVSERLISKNVHEEIVRTTKQSLDAAWIQYYVRADQMKFGMLQVTEIVENAILRNDKNSLRDMMRFWKSKRPYVDIWMVVDKDRRVIARLNSDNSGDTIHINGLIEKALISGETVISTEIISNEQLLKESEALANEVAIPINTKDTEVEYKTDSTIESDALMLTVVVPVMDQNSVIGAIITGDILNKDNFVPDTITKKIPGSIVTISKNGVTITTTMPTHGGKRAIGTLLPRDVTTILNKGEGFRGDVNIMEDTYIAAFDPIRDNKGNTIGSLFVGVQESRFTALHNENRKNILIVTILGTIMAIMIALLATSRITNPLKLLVKRAKDFANGNMDVSVPDHLTKYTKDEVSVLARSFNEMISDIKDRNKDRENYLLELEKKSKELSTLNEKMQATNQELEVSLEEAQSQQEELQSANEELTILNEELEKKTNELFDANMKIVEEESELRGMRDKLKLIYDGIRDYIFLLDPSCTILEVNRSFLEAYDMKEKDVIGKKCYDLVYGCKDIINECDISKGTDITMPRRDRVITPDNKTLERYVFPVTDAKGNLINRIEYIRDITVESMLREQLIQAEKLSSLGEILSGVAHELNNPLTGVIGYCELIYETTKDEELKTQLGKINNAAMRCKKIIENLLSFARQHKIEKQFCNINEIIKHTVELKSYQLTVDNIEVEMDLGDKMPYTMIDPYMIQQVFLNIINNAHHAILENKRNGKITVMSKHSNGIMKVSFSDTGIGIPEANLKKIFEPFYTTRDIGKGTGLGLSVSYGIIKEHGGEIYAISRPEEGSTFFIELPVVEQKAIIKDEVIKTESEGKVFNGGKKKRILVVDDEGDILDLLKSIISEMGYEAEIISDARFAVEKIMSNDFDLIITDIRMPQLDGKDFYYILADIRPDLKNRVVFTTGDVISTDTGNFLKETDCRYLEKPFTPSEVKRFIKEVFSQL